MLLSGNEMRNCAAEFYRGWEGESTERVAYLFDLYRSYATLLSEPVKPKRVLKPRLEVNK